MKTKLFNALLITGTIIGLFSCKKEAINESSSKKNELSIKSTLSTGSPKEILSLRTEAENLSRLEVEDPIRNLYDIVIWSFPVEVHETFCAWPATNCLNTVVVTPEANKTISKEQINKDGYKYEFRGEREISAEKLLGILPLLAKYPSFKSKIEKAALVKTKIVTDYKTITKYLKVYTGDNNNENLIFAAPINDGFVIKFDSI